MRFLLDPSHIGVNDLEQRGANVTHEQDLAGIARSIVDGNRFMALGTADGSGKPWVSPVWYALLSYSGATACEQLVLDDHDGRLPVHLP